MLRGVARRLRPPPAARAASAAASASAERSPPAEAPPLLLRDFLFDRLYHPRCGYFTARHGSVGALPSPLPFKHLLNRAEYIARVEAAYREAGVSWFTPVELFQPWYARALARHILRLHGASAAPLRVYELGGGGGTAARGILDAVRELAPEVYRDMRYTAVEVSAQLAARQSAAVAGAGHAARFSVERRDAADVAGWGGPDDAPCFVLALELLDNLPHDRVVRRGGGGAAGGEWQETRVAGVRDAPEAPPAPVTAEAAAPRGRERARALASAAAQPAPHESIAVAADADAHETLREVLVPLADPLVERCLGVWQRYEASRSAPARAAAAARRAFAALLPGLGGGSGGSGADAAAVYLPTTCLRLLDALAEARPSARLILADFDELPGVCLPGLRAPLVASQRGGGVTTDHDTWLLPRGAADVFFPTDFGLLQALVADAAARAGAAAQAAQQKRECRALQTATFLTEALSPGREWRHAAAASGFNPLLSEFPNTKVFVTE